MAAFGRRKKKKGKNVGFVDYKDINTLRRWLSANGKIHSRKRNKVDAKSQREIKRAVKLARYMGLLSYTA